MFNVTIGTDGACAGNPGVGGYAAILQCNGKEKVVKGYCAEMTTNNRMELMAVIAGLKALTKPSMVTVYTDSKYVADAKLHKKEWFTTFGRKNQDLWMELIEAGNKGKHRIKFVKIEGHAGHELNERCDKLAKAECKRARYAL